MKTVQVFEGDGKKPEDEFSGLCWGGFSVHANRKGEIKYHVFSKGCINSVVVTRAEFMRRASLGDEVLTRLEYGALAHRRWANQMQAKHDRGAAEFVWTIEDKMKERAL